MSSIAALVSASTKGGANPAIECTSTGGPSQSACVAFAWPGLPVSAAHAKLWAAYSTSRSNSTAP